LFRRDQGPHFSTRSKDELHNLSVHIFENQIAVNGTQWHDVLNIVKLRVCPRSIILPYILLNPIGVLGYQKILSKRLQVLIVLKFFAPIIGL